MSKIEKLKEKYAEDADMMASKSRFGFFSMPPSHTAAIPDFVGRKRKIVINQLIDNKTGKYTQNQGISFQESIQQEV